MGKSRTIRRPTHPGEMLREEYMPEYGLTVSELARLIGVSRQSISELINERRSLSPDMAVRLSRLFGDSAEAWLNLQRNVDIWEAEQSVTCEIKRLPKYGIAAMIR